MLLGFKTELKLNNQHRTAFAKHCGIARHAWNWGLGLTKQILDHNKANSAIRIKFPSAIDLHKWLVALVKSENEWYYEVSKSTPQQALMALRESWKRCFNKTAGVPKFKKKGDALGQENSRCPITTSTRGCRQINITRAGSFSQSFPR